MRAFKKAVIGFVSAAALTVGMAGAASAASYDGVCDSSGGGEACLYFNYNYTAPLYDTLYSKPSYGTSTFYGSGMNINNNVGSVWNRDPDSSLKLYTGDNYTGSRKVIAGGGKFNTYGDATFQNTFSSHCFSSNPGCPA
ncbi:peptidase inhibitor family I36 protein [Kitasatospora sp. NPDC051853]|uniref:peptidase inhibitor family I36 protein n=1 Tax=Kitasatospora sp. NPDC051853 TaxID=3364058 RepID=UPI0037A27130